MCIISCHSTLYITLAGAVGLERFSSFAESQPGWEQDRWRRACS